MKISLHLQKREQLRFLTVKFKLTILLLLTSVNVYAYNFNLISNLHQPISTLEEQIEEIPYQNNYREPLSETNIPKGYIKNVKFWRDIYSYYDSNNILIHSKIDISNVFKVVNLNKLYQNEKNEIVAEIKKNRLIEKQLNLVKKNLQNCGRKLTCPYNLNENFSVKKVLKTLRTQTGQLDILKKGLGRFELFRSTIMSIIKETNADINWIAVPFLESSFNPKAISKVGATGAWQIMHSVGRKMMPINRNVDTRKNPIISAYTGLKILRENRLITKNNDISVIAYNSGLRNYFKLKRKLKKRKITTAEYLSTSKKISKSFSFASENFLMEFHAMKEFLKKYGVIDSSKYKGRNISSGTKGRYNLFISRCKTRPSRVLKLLHYHDKDIYKVNNHFKKNALKKVLPSGQIYLTKINLPKKYYRKMKISKLDDMSPISWKANQFNCSII